MGLLGDVVVYVAHTYRDGRTRLISMRKATAKERRIYEKKVFLEHG
ncbi:MAG: BrnT family toxin [Candidatus Ozemobacteraceae bacterium]